LSHAGDRILLSACARQATGRQLGAKVVHGVGRLEQARREFHVGNLYFNRKCTGAIVGAHPFGGFNLSGTDSKAGGPDYVKLFMQPKAIAEQL
jgi:1-pyrroline-5-carboxylate dehydrogenase